MTTFVPGRTPRRWRSTPTAWRVVEPSEEKTERIRPLDFIAFATFAFGLVHLPGVGLPINEVLPMALCLLAWTRRATSNHAVPWWFPTLLLSLLGFLALTSYLHDLTPVRRLVHLCTYVSLAVLIASGRVHVPSAVRGAAVGFCVSIPLGIAGFGPNAYVGRLTGYLGDPNGAGYFITTLCVLAVGLLPRGGLRRFTLLLMVAGVVLTYSRTTLLAFSFTVLWLLIGQRVSRVFGLGLVGAMIYLVGHIPSQFKTFGPFADRTGSDELRQRIVALERIQIHQSPIIGSGAGTARVEVGQDLFFYHSSYLALQREGGLICVAIFAVLVGAVFLRATGQPVVRRNGWVEAGLICLMVCAVNLGEVLLELPGAVALGMVMWQSLNSSPPDAEEQPGVDPASIARRRATHRRAVSTVTGAGP